MSSRPRLTGRRKPESNRHTLMMRVVSWSTQKVGLSPRGGFIGLRGPYSFGVEFEKRPMASVRVSMHVR